MVDKETVQKVAKLARLYVKDDEAELYQKQFSKILEYFAALSTIDTSGVEPLRSPIQACSPLRPDIIQKEVSVEEIMKNAPDKKGALFKVPPVV